MKKYNLRIKSYFLMIYKIHELQISQYIVKKVLLEYIL